MQRVEYKTDEGLNALNDEAMKFDAAFGNHFEEENHGNMTSMTYAETGMGGPPSFLGMLEMQNRQTA